MPWFRVDDGFQRDPKVLGIPRSQRGPAVGLWTLAGTWSAANLTDGVIPEWLPDELGVPKRFASALVTAGLWAQDGAGWRFVDWSPNQPTRAEVEAKRAKRAAAGKLGGQASGQSRRRTSEASAKQSASEALDGCFDNVEPPARPGPTRPASLLTYVSRLAGGNARETDAACLPPELIEQWQEIAGLRVNLEREARAYIAYYADRPARNERSAWVGWLRRARSHVEATAPPPDTPGRPLVVACSDPLCIGGWLPSAPGDPARPCLLCRPHLVRQPVQDSAAGAVL